MIKTRLQLHTGELGTTGRALATARAIVAEGAGAGGGGGAKSRGKKGGIAAASVSTKFKSQVGGWVRSVG